MVAYFTKVIVVILRNLKLKPLSPPPPIPKLRNMNYSQRLIAAAKYVYAGELRAAGANINPDDLQINATLKPHQLEGISWLIRRFHLGVNVVLGINLSFHSNSILSQN